MKLFTIFTSDDRALEHVRADSGRGSTSLVKRVANHQEWGVRVVLDRAAAERASARRSERSARPRLPARLARPT